MFDPITAITAATSIVGAISGRNARKDAQGAADRASRLSAEEQAKFQEANEATLAFEQDRYDEWKSIYGPMEQNLASYYNSLNPETYAAQGIEAFETERSAAMTNVEEMLAQRGITTDSGVSANVAIQDAMGAASTRAGIRADAPRKVIADQTSFLSAGMQGKPDLGAAKRDYATGLRTGSVRADVMAEREQSRLSTAMQSEASAVGTAVDAIGTGLSDYLTSRPPSDVTNYDDSGTVYESSLPTDRANAGVA